MNFEARMTDFAADPGADGGASARHLAAAAEPVFIFDGKQPVLVWANAAALAFVGHASVPGAQLPHLDRSMPAMARLRAIADQEMPAGGLRTELVFWTPRGALGLACVCRRASFAFAPEAIIVHAVAVEPADAKPATLAVETKQTMPAGKDRHERARGKTPKSRALKAKPATKSAGKSAHGARAKTKSREDLRARRGRNSGKIDQGPKPETAAIEQPLPLPQPTQPSEASNDIALREIARQIQAATQAPGHAPPARVHGGGQVLGRSPMLFDGERDAPPAAAVRPQQGAAGPGVAAPLQLVSQFPTQSRHNIDFLSHIGHEIRTPLNSILGFAEIMREERLGAIGNDRYKTYAADIHDSALHALGLINDLLDLSRIEAGGLQLDLAEVDVAPVMAQAVASLQPIAAKAEVILSAPTGRPLPKLVCDARALKQMLLNLLTNAIKHTDAGGAVWITAATGDDGGLVMRVQDTGVGMRAEDIALALEPYGQVGSAERRAGGTGLGLPLTKAMAEANGGQLRLERIAGGGLAALLVFPADRAVRS